MASVALLRAVGHTLRNVDAATDVLLKKIVDDAWARLIATKPEPTIFWQFIEDERNNILKEYRIAAGVGITIRPGTAHMNLSSGEQWSEPGLPTLFDYKMNSGPYKGQDQREVLRSAIEWWDTYLAGVEQAYENQKP